MARTGFLTILALIALLLACIACPQTARAADCPNAMSCDQGKAFSMCKAAVARTLERFRGTNPPGVEPRVAQDCVSFGSPRYDCAVSESASGGSVRCWNADGTNSSGFHYGDTCDKRPDWNGPYPYLSGGKPTNGSVTCNAGCRQAWFSTGDGYFNGKYNSVPGTCDNYTEERCQAQFGYSWNPAMSACEPDGDKCPNGQPANSLGQCAPEPCPEGKVQQADGTCKNKANECPAGQIKSPDGKCLPGDGHCASGEVRGKDGTCKKDTDGDGNPDEGEEGGEDSEGKKKDEFSGGDDCKSPPSCSGSPIMCGQARIQWRIDCNTRKNRNIAGGTCATPPVCTGEKCDALEYSGLLMQWRTACATEKLAQGTGTGGDGQPAWTMVSGMSQDPGAGATENDTKVLTVKKLSVDDLDQSGIGGGGGGCIGFAASGGTGLGSGFAQAMASPPAFFCNYIGVLKAICLIGASVVSVIILVSGGKS